jgi:hypothetical protein
MISPWKFSILRGEKQAIYHCINKCMGGTGHPLEEARTKAETRVRQSRNKRLRI